MLPGGNIASVNFCKWDKFVQTFCLKKSPIINNIYFLFHHVRSEKEKLQMFTFATDSKSEKYAILALAGDIVLCSWERHLTLTVPLSTVYKCVPTKLYRG